MAKARAWPLWPRRYASLLNAARARPIGPRTDGAAALAHAIGFPSGPQVAASARRRLHSGPTFRAWLTSALSPPRCRSDATANSHETIWTRIDIARPKSDLGFGATPTSLPRAKNDYENPGRKNFLIPRSIRRICRYSTACVSRDPGFGNFSRSRDCLGARLPLAHRKTSPVSSGRDTRHDARAVMGAGRPARTGRERGRSPPPGGAAEDPGDGVPQHLREEKSGAYRPRSRLQRK